MPATSPLGEVTDEDVQTLIFSYLHWRTHQVGRRRCAEMEEQAMATRDRLVEMLLARGGQQARIKMEISVFDSGVSDCGHPDEGPLPAIVHRDEPWAIDFGYEWSDEGVLASEIGATFRAMLLVVILYGGRLTLSPVITASRELPSTTWEIRDWVEVLVRHE